MKSYRDFCRPAHKVERTVKEPGHLVLNSTSVERVPGKPKVVNIGGRRQGQAGA